VGEGVLSDLDALLLRRRGWTARPPRGEHVVALASGGLDSTVAMAWCAEELGATVHPLFVRRAARATPFEEAALDRVVVSLRGRYGERIASPLKIEAEIPPLDLKPCFAGRAATLGHPMRDASLQNLAVQQAVALQGSRGLAIRTIITGAIADDPFPHTSLVSLRAETLLVCLDTDDWDWQITSPFVDPLLGPPRRKSQLVRWAAERELPLADTRTCVGDGPRPDGTCAECRWRRAAFLEAGLDDPAVAP